MIFSRRSVMFGLAASSLKISGASGQVLFDSGPPLPRPEIFESGDLIWPKKPGVFVPYSQQSGIEVDQDRLIWEREKQEFLSRARLQPSIFPPEQLAALEQLEYREFLARYQADQLPNTPGVYSTGGGLYVGHVGIIDITPSRSIFVIEALWGKGVVRHSYDDWLASRLGEVVWLGRLKGRPSDERARIVPVASKMIGRPYDFWNFDLNDDKSFYCSKLIWQAIFRGLGFAVDGNNDPKRSFWFSPKQLLYLPAINRIHDPGPYAIR